MLWPNYSKQRWQNLHVTDFDTKAGHRIAQHAYHQTAHLFMSQNDHYLSNTINFNYVSPPPLHF